MKNEIMKHIINCDADPFIPSGWSVESHTKSGQLAFNPAKIKFYLSPNQQDNKVIKGKQLRKELANEFVLNANVLDFLLAHQELIPEDWKEDEQGNTRFIFFWGTIYCGLSGGLGVRCLCWVGKRWDWDYRWLNGGRSSYGPAAVSAS